MQEKPREQWVDAFKGIAILMVVLTHSGIDNLTGFLHRVASAGKTGVSIFFIISMYLLLLSYDKVYKENGSKNKWKGNLKWIKKRIGSLLGLYFLIIVLSACLIGGSEFWLGGEGEISLLNYLTHFLCINSFFPHYLNSIIGVEWYISILFIVIFLTPIIYKLSNSLDKSIVFLIISLFIYALGSRVPVYIPDVADKYIYENYFSWMSLSSNLPILALGSVIYNLKRENLKIPSARSFLISNGLLLYGIFMIWGMLYNYTQIYYVSSGIIYAFIYFMIIMSQIINPCFLINNGFFRFFGRNSYSIYLVHYLLFKIIDKYFYEYFQSGLFSWFIKLVLVIIICIFFSLLYNWFNKWIATIIFDKDKK